MAKQIEPVSIILRIRPDLHKDAKRIARKKFMSLNGLINSVIEKEVKTEQKRTLQVSQ